MVANSVGLTMVSTICCKNSPNCKISSSKFRTSSGFKTQCILDAHRARGTTCLSCLSLNGTGLQWSKDLPPASIWSWSFRLTVLTDSTGAPSICSSLGRWWPRFFRSSSSDFSQPCWFSCYHLCLSLRAWLSALLRTYIQPLGDATSILGPSLHSQ